MEFNFKDIVQFFKIGPILQNCMIFLKLHAFPEVVGNFQNGRVFSIAAKYFDKAITLRSPQSASVPCRRPQPPNREGEGGIYLVRNSEITEECLDQRFVTNPEVDTEWGRGI